MKKYYILALGLFAALVSCNKDAEEVIAPENNPSAAPLSFVVSSPETKTTLDGLHVRWAAGDEIRVYGHNTDADTYTDNAVYELTAGAGDGTATFTLKDGETGLSGTYDAYYAVYPGNLEVTLSGSPLKMAFPRLYTSPNHLRAQDPEAGQYDPNLAVMTAHYDGSRLVFHHGMAYIKLTIPESGVTAVKIDFGNNCLADTPTYTASSGELSGTGNSSTNVQTKSGSFTQGATYYFPAIPRSGYTIGTTTITLTGGSTYTTSHFSGKSLVIGEVFDLGTPAKSPAVSADNVTIDAVATGGTVSFNVTNLVDGGVVTKEVLAGATIANLNVGAVSFNASTGVGSFPFTCDNNEDTSNPKEATIRLTYTYNTDQTATKDVTITQRKANSGGTVDYVWDFSSDEWQAALTAQANDAKGTNNSSWTVTYDDLTFTAGGSNAKWDPTFITTGGNGSKSKRVFTFTATVAGTLSVWSSNTSNSADNSRKVNVVVGAGDPETQDGGAASSSPVQLDFDIAAGDVYIYTTNSLRIYKIEFHE